MTAFPKSQGNAPQKAQRSHIGRGPYAKSLSKSRRIQKQVGGDRRKIPYDPDGRRGEVAVPEFQEGQTYTKRQLTLMAEGLLRDQHLEDLDAKEHPAILLWPMLQRRLQREIYVGSGIPDPSIEQGMYWRTHPEGRKWRTPEEMTEQSASFYR